MWVFGRRLKRAARQDPHAYLIYSDKRYVEDSCKPRTQPAALFTLRYLHDTIRSQFIDFHTAIAGPEFNIPPRMILPDEVEHIWL